jgi:hypothetical protein
MTRPANLLNLNLKQAQGQQHIAKPHHEAQEHHAHVSHTSKPKHAHTAGTAHGTPHEKAGPQGGHTSKHHQNAPTEKGLSGNKTAHKAKGSSEHQATPSTGGTKAAKYVFHHIHSSQALPKSR